LPLTAHFSSVGFSTSSSSVLNNPFLDNQLPAGRCNVGAPGVSQHHAQARVVALLGVVARIEI
jgi:hypothetical protein